MDIIIAGVLLSFMVMVDGWIYIGYTVHKKKKKNGKKAEKIVKRFVN